MPKITIPKKIERGITPFKDSEIKCNQIIDTLSQIVEQMPESFSGEGITITNDNFHKLQNKVLEVDANLKQDTQNDWEEEFNEQFCVGEKGHYFGLADFITDSVIKDFISKVRQQGVEYGITVGVAKEKIVCLEKKREAHNQAIDEAVKICDEFQEKLDKIGDSGSATIEVIKGRLLSLKKPN